MELALEEEDIVGDLPQMV